MKARLTGIALIALVISTGWTLTLAQGGAPQTPPAAGGAAPQRGGGGGGGGGGAAGGGGGGQRGGGGRGGGNAAPALPAPRWPDGRIMLNSGPGEQKGLWHGAFSISATNVPYQPWSRALAAQRARDYLEPHARCHPSGAARQFVTPYGVDFVEMPELKRVYIFDVGGPHTFRTIYTDGRPHPKNAERTAYGHSTGTWEGDTFVVDTVSYNEAFWIYRSDNARGGFVSTDQLHTIEKFTRTSMTQMRYELTIDDPGAYTATWTADPYNITLQTNEELFEYVCQDNNQGAELMVGTMTSVDRRTPIAP
jgi:hypothetical protein